MTERGGLVTPHAYCDQVQFRSIAPTLEAVAGHFVNMWEISDSYEDRGMERSERCDAAEPLVKQVQAISLDHIHTTPRSRRIQWGIDVKVDAPRRAKGLADNSYLRRNTCESSKTEITKSMNAKRDEKTAFCGISCDLQLEYASGGSKSLRHNAAVIGPQYGSHGWRPVGDARGSLSSASNGPVASTQDTISEGREDCGSASLVMPVATLVDGGESGWLGITDPRDRSSKMDCHRKMTPGKAELSILLSCPFYKWKPAIYKKCGSAGLPSVEALKEHLLEQHAAPIHCARCYAEFNTVQERDIHLRSVDCEKKEFRVMDGYGETARREMARLADTVTTPSAQWRALYNILFPGQLQPTSPFFEGEITAAIARAPLA